MGQYLTVQSRIVDKRNLLDAEVSFFFFRQTTEESLANTVSREVLFSACFVLSVRL